MIATGILHQSPWTWNVVAWAVGFALLLLAFAATLLITDFMRPKRPALVSRALFTFGPAVFVAPLFFLGIRLLQLIEPSIGAGPQHWLIGWIPGMSNDFVHPYDTVVSVHIASAGLAAVIAVGAALLFQPRQGRAEAVPLPGRLPASALLGTVALLLPFLAFRVYVQDNDAAALLDFIGLLPTVSIAAMLRLHAWLPPLPPPPVRAPDAPEARPPVDHRAAWVEAGLLKADAKALLRQTPSVSMSEPSARAAAAWTAIDGTGSPPESLDTLLDQLPWVPARTRAEGGAVAVGRMAPAKLFCVGELPSDVEHALLTAVLADMVGVHGMRVLLLHPQPAELTQQVERALIRARTWSPGTLAIGPAGMQECLSRMQAPALAAMELGQFAEDFVRLASSSARSWVAGLDLIVLHRPDLGTPVEVTHTTFACARWDLATGRVNRPPVLLTLPNGGAFDAFAERLFPGRNTQRVHYGPRSAGSSTIWPGLEPDPTAPIPWLARASRAITNKGEPVIALDPAGRWSGDVLPEPAQLHREPCWNLGSSVAQLQPASLVHAVGTLVNRLPEPAQHHSLWRVPDDPVARFLHPSRLNRLAASGRLPRPTPIVGTRNRFLRMAHLDLALRETRNDERSLRQAFGDDLVDHRLNNADGVVREASSSAWRENGRIVRSAHLSSVAPPSTELHSGTVTGDIVDIIDGRSGEVVDRIDRKLAPTRFYPKRVFTHGDRRYRVPMHSYDAKRGKLTVQLAAARDHVTQPVCSFSLHRIRTTVDRLSRRHGRFEMHTTSADCTVTERVHAAWVPALDQEERFDTVESTYSTEVRFVFPTLAEKGLGLFHLAAQVEALMPVFLRCASSDVAVSPVPAGFMPGLGAGVAVIDRYPGGMGMARALDDGAIAEILTWARAMAYECTCMEGCKKCTPTQVLRVGPDKQALLKMLDGL